MHQARIDWCQVLEAQALTLGEVGSKTVDQHVGARHEFFQHLAAGRLAEVQAQRFLAAVAHHEQRGHFAAERWAEAAAFLAGEGLDLDDARAVMRERHRGVRAGHEPRQVQDGDARKGAHAAGLGGRKHTVSVKSATCSPRWLITRWRISSSV